MESHDESVGDTRTKHAEPPAESASRDVAGRSALLIAIIASFIVIGLDMFANFLPSLVGAMDLTPIEVFNIYGILRRGVVGVLGLVAVLLALVSLRTPRSARNSATAAIALGGFHFIWVFANVIADLIGA